MVLTVPFLLSILLPSTSASCYWPNGADRNAAYNASANGSLTVSYYQPCPTTTPGQSFSMCCAAGNTCQSNGLCWSSGAGMYWRESCSDPTWESAACVKLFVNGTGAYNDIQITECADGNFCYGAGNEDCCAAGEGVYIVDGNQESHNFNSSSTMGISSTAVGTSAITQATPTASTLIVSSRTPTSTPISTSTPIPSSALPPSAIAGISAAVAVIVLIVLGLGTWFLLRHRRNRASSSNDGGAAESKEETWKWRRHEVQAEPRVLIREEMEGGDVGGEGQSKELGGIGVAELSGGEGQRRELPAGGPMGGI